MLPVSTKNIFGIGLLFFATLALSETALHESENQVAYPCANGSILTYFKRPTVASSACPVPYGQFTIEGGVQYNDFIHQGEKWNLPQSKTRIGLPWRSELSILFPSEKINPHYNISGLTSTQLALKHEFTYSKHWNIAARAIYIPASGGQHFGTANNGYTLNGILAYRNNKLSVTAMLGISSFSTSKTAGGLDYNAFSPDLLISWYAKNWLQLYTEVFGQTRSAPNQGPGYVLNTGVVFLITHDIAFDMEVGQRLFGHLGAFNTYYGSGISFMF